jgi:hypothetical protein
MIFKIVEGFNIVEDMVFAEVSFTTRFYKGLQYSFLVCYCRDAAAFYLFMNIICKGLGKK